MKKIFTLSMIAACMILYLHATCGPKKPFSTPPVQVVKITDHVYFHNVSIASDGMYYYTLNGGNDEYCKINKYDLKGGFLKSYDVGLDGRALFYNPNDKKFYVKIYGGDLYSINLEYESAKIEFEYLFEEDNSSPGATTNGKYLFELVDGIVTVYDFATGEEQRSFRITEYYDEHGFASSTAASDEYLFVWGAEDELYVYDFKGNLVAEIMLPRTGYGFSLSYCNGLLWIAKDADASTYGEDGYWYGYKF